MGGGTSGPSRLAAYLAGTGETDEDQFGHPVTVAGEGVRSATRSAASGAGSLEPHALLSGQAGGDVMSSPDVSGLLQASSSPATEAAPAFSFAPDGTMVSAQSQADQHSALPDSAAGS